MSLYIIVLNLLIVREGEADVFGMEEQACGLKKEENSATSSVSNLTEDAPPPAPKQQEVGIVGLLSLYSYR